MDGLEFYYSAPGHLAKRGLATLTPYDADPNIWQSEKEFIAGGKTSLKASPAAGSVQWVSDKLRTYIGHSEKVTELFSTI